MLNLLLLAKQNTVFLLQHLLKSEMESFIAGKDFYARQERLV